MEDKIKIPKDFENETQKTERLWIDRRLCKDSYEYRKLAQILMEME